MAGDTEKRAASLEGDRLCAQRGHATLFADVSFAVRDGSALVVTGPNGSGKTTLLRILAGLTAPAAGEVRWRHAVARPFDARLRAACDMPPPLRGAALWPGCVRALSVDAVGFVRAMLGLLRVAPGLVRGATFDGVVVR